MRKPKTVTRLSDARLLARFFFLQNKDALTDLDRYLKQDHKRRILGVGSLFCWYRNFITRLRNARVK